MSGIALIITFAIAIVVMILLISKLNVHPFLSIMGVALVLAIVAGIPLGSISGIIGTGFSSIFSSIGIVIILGALIGVIVEKTGAAIKIADAVVRLVGKKNPELALLIMGWVVAIPVFCDSGYVILNPIRKSLRKRTQKSAVAMTVCLSAGLYVAHVFIPPTPGPIAAASSLGLGENLLLVMGIGALISIFALVPAYFYAKYIGKKIKTAEELGEEKINDEEIAQAYETLKAEYGVMPNTFMSFAPIIAPIVALAMGSIASMAGWTSPIWSFIGAAIIALTIGLIFAIILLAMTGKMKDFYEITNDTLKTVGPILFITAAGGVLGTVITNAGFVTYIQENVEFFAAIGIFFPFIVAAILKSAQGSSTVAIVTTAAIMGSYADPTSLSVALGFSSAIGAALAVMAIGAGSMTVSHANDSYFWVVTNLSDMDPKQGYKTHTMTTLIMGISSMVGIFILSLFLL